jgi:hypothetical protein
MLSSQIGHFFHLEAFPDFAVSSLELDCMNRIKQGQQKIWPHFAMRGATGSDRQIGQDAVCDSLEAIICIT